MKKVNYKEKGITLIALVITIIILLILAGVTLNTALSQNGLFQRAKIAGENYKRAEADETEKLGEVEKEIDKIVNGETPSSGIGSSDIAGNLKDYQGKYVDIGLDINGNNKVDDWEIFYVNEDRIFLIAADYVPTEKLEAWGVIGSSTKLDNGGLKKVDSTSYCVRWYPSAPTNFFDGLPDLELVMHNNYDLVSNQTNPSSKAVSQLLDTEAWSGIKKAVSEEKRNLIDFVIGGPTLEMWCAAWKEAIKGDTNGFVEIKPEGTNASGYYVSSEQSEMQNMDYLYVNGTKTKLEDKLTTLGENYKTFFPHTNRFDDCGGYRLASPSSESSMNTSKYLLRVDYDGCVSREFRLR